ncbi:FecR domain-containing protein [Kerstersia gyiorum]|uniref:FecR family protein n=1 Tax=Kerstersia gyiorum TaxID=206506 RepID=A0A4Q7MEZ6_9BURK|nr:FecR domain-containing protein [Kerstersia gyiorum]KAB0542081.1 DUF4880 domain-containing protein [Kerstersia gyiorum]MCP1633564.1 transmembrane sensor [Kerstersia gyiorum]MCP1637180.1 transmembrane sensor [Kerstersia gyiorum]MCP1672145.1 transmembrane sensor [Kerstersia gyiorum]MCP1679638.1 transmembrane sensor [Kerstersia gyiorum]
MSARDEGAVALPNEKLLDQAIDWLLRVNDDASGNAEAACRRWRAEHPDHERAWQGVVSVGARLRGSTASMAPRAAVKVLHQASAAQGRRAAIKTLMLGGAFAVGAGAVWQGNRAWPAWNAAYRTARGETREVLLADGASIWLNTDTALDIDITQAGNTLLLRRGEILVQTGHDPAVKQPMWVHTQAGVMEPLGTRFIARVLDGGEVTRLSVLEAQVRVQGPTLPQPLELAAGQQLDFGPQASQQIENIQGDPAAWQQGMFAASRMRLDVFLKELSRYRSGVIQCDPNVAHLTVTGAFPLGDTDRVLDALPQDLPVRVQQLSRYWIRVLPKKL